MLGRQYSLKNQADFTAVRRTGRRARTEHLGFFFLPTGNQLSRFGVVVGSKVAGSSVTRNQIRRAILEIIREVKPHWEETPAQDIVIQVMKKPEDNMTEALQQEVKECLARR